MTAVTVKAARRSRRRHNNSKSSVTDSFVKTRLFSSCDHLFVKCVLAVSLGAVFAWSSYHTVEKYLAGKTSVQISQSDDGFVLFPSLTFCKWHTFDRLVGVIDLLNGNKSMTEAEARDWSLLHTPRRDAVFQFLGHSLVDR